MPNQQRPRNDRMRASRGTAGDPRFPSDLLATIRPFVSLWPSMAELLSLPVQIKVVVDASFVQKSIRYQHSKASNPSFRVAVQELADAGTLSLFAPDFLRTEIEEKIPKIAAELGETEATIRSTWATYERRIKFVATTLVASIRVENIERDPKDAPYVQVATAIGAIGVLTTDKDFEGMGMTVITKDDLLPLVDHAREEAVHLSITVGGSIGTVISGHALLGILNSVARLVGAGIRQLPSIARVALAAITAGVALHPGGRKFAREVVERAARPIISLWQQVKPDVVKLIERSVSAKDRAGKLAADSQLLRVRRSSPLYKHIFASVASSVTPMSVAQIESALRSTGYRSKAKNLSPYIIRTLRTRKEFCQVGLGWVATPVQPVERSVSSNAESR